MLSLLEMIFYHHDLKVELDEFWRAEAQMAGFVPSGTAYRLDQAVANGQRVFEARIAEIAPVRRKPGVGTFNDNEEMTARERILRILNGFRGGVAIPPIELVGIPAGSPFRYKLTAGTHRLYCSLAVGFSHVPAIEGFEITARRISEGRGGRVSALRWAERLQARWLLHNGKAGLEFAAKCLIDDRRKHSLEFCGGFELHLLNSSYAIECC